MPNRSVRKAALEALRDLTGDANLGHADVERYPQTMRRPTREQIREVAERMADMKVGRRR